MRGRLTTAAAMATVMVVAACGSSTPPARPSTSVTALATPSPGSPPDSSPVAPLSPDERAAAALARMSEVDRVGQLVMVGSASTAPDPSALSAVADQHIGSIILNGTSHLTVGQTKAVVNELTANAGPVPLFIATDQEGGEVQRLVGPGFTRIPTALEQGAMAPAALTTQAATWAGQLKAAGVNLNLGPVLDTVPSAAFASQNPPIGQFDRELGFDPADVSSHGLAILAGFQQAGVATTIKHFPGLGRVTGNTDITAGVTDGVTTASDPYIVPFRDAVESGAPLVMMSSAIYSQIDPAHPAAFSPTVIGLLRNGLKFNGVVISDDLSAAAQVADVPVAQRGIDFVAAGGDIVLCVVAAAGAAMDEAMLAKTQSDPTFKALVDAAALRVLQAKARYGLLG